jgi:hypothetical protein
VKIRRVTTAVVEANFDWTFVRVERQTVSSAPAKRSSLRG